MWFYPGVLYGLPKVHKSGCPFRPIISSVKTYNYNLASYLLRILQPISTNQFTIKDSFSFADWPRRITITMKWCARLTLVRRLQTFHATWWDKKNLSWQVVCPPWPTNAAPLSIECFAWVCNKEEPFHIWRPLLRPSWWRSNGLSLRSCFGQYLYVPVWGEVGA